MRQNEREIKFIRVGDAVRTVGQLKEELLSLFFWAGAWGSSKNFYLLLHSKTLLGFICSFVLGSPQGWDMISVDLYLPNGLLPLLTEAPYSRNKG